MKMMMSNASI
jgi:hypothetical protein